MDSQFITRGTSCAHNTIAAVRHCFIPQTRCEQRGVSRSYAAQAGPIQGISVTSNPLRTRCTDASLKTGLSGSRCPVGSRRSPTSMPPRLTRTRCARLPCQPASAMARPSLAASATLPMSASPREWSRRPTAWPSGTAGAATAATATRAMAISATATLGMAMWYAPQTATP